MIEKQFTSTHGQAAVLVTFTLPETLVADQIFLVGDFNDWNHSAHPLRRDTYGQWTIQIKLEQNRIYQFRYLLDGRHWLNDEAADVYIPNRYATSNFVVVTNPDFKT